MPRDQDAQLRNWSRQIFEIRTRSVAMTAVVTIKEATSAMEPSLDSKNALVTVACCGNRRPACNRRPATDAVARPRLFPMYIYISNTHLDTPARRTKMELVLTAGPAAESIHRRSS